MSNTRKHEYISSTLAEARSNISRVKEDNDKKQVTILYQSRDPKSKIEAPYTLRIEVSKKPVVVEKEPENDPPKEQPEEKTE